MMRLGTAGGAMMWGMGLLAILVAVLVVLGIAAVVELLLRDRR